MLGHKVPDYAYKGGDKQKREQWTVKVCGSESVMGISSAALLLPSHFYLRVPQHQRTPHPVTPLSFLINVSLAFVFCSECRQIPAVPLGSRSVVLAEVPDPFIRVVNLAPLVYRGDVTPV